MTNEQRSPHFNHVAMSMPAELLGADGRRDICDFYGEVFGWEEMPTMTLDRKRLVLQAYSFEQFVFLIAGDEEPMRCPRLDHFGMSVGTLGELEEMEKRARTYRERDDRVDIVDRSVERHADVLDLHNFYVGFLLPMMVEVQYYDWDREAVDAVAERS